MLPAGQQKNQSLILDWDEKFSLLHSFQPQPASDPVGTLGTFSGVNMVGTSIDRPPLVGEVSANVCG
jgi:hypothetical protein